ncbi:MAG: ImmA/IrrE family metallo-endopeptidase [Myxococcales bacterium]|nr:ImmA/IrrE family metallo-endopeptidase [Myxococcales bacterium]
MSDARYWKAALKAEEFLAGRTTPASLPIDPFEIARELAIEVQAKPATASGVSGMLARHGDVFGILYATHIASEGYRRFSVAHELGHYLLPGHMDHVLPNGQGIHESRAGFVSPDPFEMEADHFAAGLLMPARLVSKALTRMGDGLGAVEQLSDLCKTSLTASAIRYAERTTTSVAVVVSTGQLVDYCFMSKSLREFDGLDWLRKKERLPAGCQTQRFNSQPANVENAERADAETDLRDWFGGSRKLPGIEEVIGLGSYGKTLTILTTEIEQDDEDEDEDLEESWTPRFRR